MMMNRSLHRPATAVLGLVVLLAAGCQSPSADTVLLKKDPGSSVIYRAPGENDVPYATNVVHVPRDSRFSLGLEAINPGWLHEAAAGRQTSNPSGSPFQFGEPALAGKDLWILIKVRSLASAGALSVDQKLVSRASVIKHDLRSFGLIPLTLDEVTPFALEADTDYEVEIRLYEVAGAFQRLGGDTRPGLPGVGRAAWTTTTDTFKALLGDSATRAVRTMPATDFPIERQLLDAGGSLCFNARFAIYRSNETLAPRLPGDDSRGGTLVNHYQVTDPYNRRDTDRRDPRKRARYTDAASYLEAVQTLENTEVPGRQDAFIRFRIESMWSPSAQVLAQIQSAPATPENVSQEQALAAESLATTARDTFLKVSESEKQARLAVGEALRKSDSATSAELEKTARDLAGKTQEVTAARTAMETAQARARETRQAVETAASRAAETANAEKTAALAGAALEIARRTTEAAVRDLDTARAALRRTRDSAEAARLKKEEWMQTEASAQLRLDAAREQLAALARKAEKHPNDPALRQKLTTAEQVVADTAKALETATSEWRLAQKDQDAKLSEVEDLLKTVAQQRTALAEAEQERQRARAAKDQADARLNGTDAADPRPAILRAGSL